MFSCGAQIVSEQFEFNNFRWSTSLKGIMFTDEENGLPGMEVPINSGNHAVFSANYWIGGITQDDTLRFSGSHFCNVVGCQFGPGPLRLDGSFDEVEAEDSPYNRFWEVNAEQVAEHLAYFDCLNNPGCGVEIAFPEGYEVPADFLDWPAMGDDEDGFATYLAPFYDYNGDGVYDANDGDHPVFCGDMAVYAIVNDVGFRPDNSNVGPGLGIEMHQMFYAYDEPGDALFNSVLVQQKIINRSSDTYSDVYMAMANEFDLGNPVDDYVGTDVERSMVYVYNGSSFDEGSASGPGYGDDLPMLGMRILAGPFKDANGEDDAPLSPNYERYGNQTSGWGDGVADNERLGLSSSIYYPFSGQGPFAAQGFPAIPVEHYDYMQALWKDGTPLSYGSWGYDTTGTAPAAKYIWPGVSDPLFAATDFIDPDYPDSDGWGEEASENPPGFRRMLASSGPFTFAPGDEQYFDFAYIFARDSHEPGTDVFETLQSYADAIVGMECSPLPQITVSVRDVSPEALGLRLYPNPASDAVTLGSQSHSAGRYTVFDLMGKAVMQANTRGTRTEISVGHLPKGMYLIRYEAEGEAAVKKLVID